MPRKIYLTSFCEFVVAESGSLVEAGPAAVTLADGRVLKQIHSSIARELNVIRSSIPPQKIEVVSPGPIITGVEQQLKSMAPATLASITSGKGGDVFATTVFTKLLSLLDSELAKVSWVTKKTLQASVMLSSPTRAGLKKSLEEGEAFDSYYEMFESLVDFTMFIGWMDETDSYKDKLWQFDSQKGNWLQQNRKMVKNAVIEKILNFLYD